MTAKSKPSLPKLSRRERQIMDIVYGKRQATAAEIHEALPDRPTFSATRATIRTLEEKGHLQHQEQGLKYLYLPTVPVEKARSSALLHMLATFFAGSPAQLMATLLDESSVRVSNEELKTLESMIRKAKEESR